MMKQKKINPWKVSTLVLGTALALSFTLRAAYADPPAPAPQPQPQPKMQAALASLRQAREQLQEATADKGGHRIKAIQHTNEAIDDVKAGIEFDNKH